MGGGPTIRRSSMPWRMIDGPEAADAFVNEIATRALTRLASRTSMSPGATHFAQALVRRQRLSGIRRVSTSPATAPTTADPFVTHRAR